jgi:hypothetical protein
MTTPLEAKLRMAKAQYATIEMALHSLHLYREIPTDAHHSLNHVSEVLMNDLIINWHSIFCKVHAPEQTGHRFHYYPDARSVLIRTPILI